MSTANEPKTILPDELRAKIAAREEIFLIDLREPRAYHAGHIDDAVLLPADDFADRYTREIDAEDSIVLICERGLTADAAARFLITQGFTDVSVLQGGMAAWHG